MYFRDKGLLLRTTLFGLAPRSARKTANVVLGTGFGIADGIVVDTHVDRLAHRIVWVNPRAAAPGFAPLAGGMAAALPHVDELVSGHSLAALQDVVEAIGGRDAV